MAANKAAFFKELDDLDHLSSDEYICDPLDNNLQYPTASGESYLGEKTFSLHAIPGTALGTLPEYANRAHLADIDSNEVTVIRETPLSKVLQNKTSSSVMKRAVQSKQPDGERSGGPKKKRRTVNLKFVPEERQILKGLVFFFIPNDDIAPARRLRIQRSREYGASWARQWGEDVTHIIVEKELAFQDVLKFLGVDRLPPHVALVNQDYPSECLRFSFVLNTAQTRFRLKDAPTEQPNSNTGSTPSTEICEKSLQIIGRRKSIGGSLSPTLSEPSPRRSAHLTGQTSQNVEQTNHHPRIPRERDPLNDIISEVKAISDLPLGASDDEEITLKNTNVDQRLPGWQQTFSCMQPPLSEKGSQNPNSRTIEILQQLMSYYDRTADHWRTIAYRKCISTLRKQSVKISTKEQALAIPGVGERLADKIEEIVCTDRLRRLENTNLTSEDKALQLFIGVYGAGFAQASRWIAMGHRSLEDLKTKAELTRNQRIGLERYDHFHTRIPRDEVRMHGEIVRQAVMQADGDMDVIIGGSYRRGAADSGDIDCLVTKPGATVDLIRTVMMDTVIPALFKQDFLKASLATSSRVEGSKWHGASCLPGHQTWRRIDLLFVPGDEIGAALLYFTGNDIFNRSMRLLARKKGLCLNQHGLFKNVLRNRYAVKESAGTLVEARDEKRIFEFLGVPWREPEQRIC